MFLRAALFATVVAAGPAAGESLSVGLRVGVPPACGESGCLRIVEGRYLPATIAGAAPDARDRTLCAAGFERFVVAFVAGRSLERQGLHRLRRCRALGLAPVIVGG